MYAKVPIRDTMGSTASLANYLILIKPILAYPSALLSKTAYLILSRKCSAARVSRKSLEETYIHNNVTVGYKKEKK